VKPVTFGLLVGNRGFFPGHLCESGRRQMLSVLEGAEYRVIALSPEETRYGSIESLEDARKAAVQLRAHHSEIDGVIVTLPNFGDERAIAQALRGSGLEVPVLVHAFPDRADRMTVKDRRDSFCGKISVCNNLRQFGIPFTLTRSHTQDPGGAAFAEDLADFAATCRVVRSLRGMRIGALGARPTAFNTVRYSEKLLERHGISVETMDLFECFGRISRLKDDDAAVREKLDGIRGYVETGNVPQLALLKMAKLGVVVDQWMDEAALDATAIQCWTAMEEFYGVVPCTVMSRLSDSLMPSACEVDVMGALAMAVLARATGRPAALLDWNNNYGDDPDKCVVFHCSNLPLGVFDTAGGEVRMDYQEIIAGTVGKENTYGTINGRMSAGPFTYLRIGTDDEYGDIRAYVGEGEMTPDPLDTFGGYGVARVPDLQSLLQYVCENGFEHHVSAAFGERADAIREALNKYLGWDVYQHLG